MRPVAAVALVLPGLVACGALAEGDGRTPGDDLGRFRVAATLERSTCGPDALGAPNDWSFDIQLARDDGFLYWNQGGAAVEGTLDGKDFELASDTVVELAPASEESPGCTMLRRDRAEGSLNSSGFDVERFSGELTYAFESQPGTDCTPLIGVQGGFAALPCSILYRIEARRNLAPADRHR